ncbi:Uncharacterised protein [Yersinia intermedia]|nr:Uncharacterised protein [Yersinia intermedia]
MTNDEYVSCLMLGGDYHREMLRIHRDIRVVNLYPKNSQLTHPTDTIEILVYKVSEYFNKKGQRYLIAACQPLETFDIETELLNAGALLHR